MGEESRTFDLGSVVAITAVPNIAEPPEATVTFVGKNADKADALAAAGPDPVATGYVVKYNDYKWSSGDYYFLIDCALGTSRGRPETMIAALTAAGFADLEMYKGILLSQIDPKHPDSLCLDGKPVFTKSQVFIPAFDILKKDDPSYGRDDVARILPMAPVSATLQGDGRAGDSGLFMTDRLAPGPSCGHILIEGQLGGGVIMYFLGELLRHPAVQLPYPDVSGSDDDDPELAAKTRIAVLGEAADKGILVAGTHLPFPGSSLRKFLLVKINILNN